MTVFDMGTSDSISVAIETNGKGFIGFLVELPGAYARGTTESELLSKVPAEARAYLDWLGMSGGSLSRGRVVERHRCGLNVEDADGEILLEADRGLMQQDEFQRFRTIALKSGETFMSLYDSSQLKDWIDQSRVRRTFYGQAPSTIREVFSHVESTQHYYLSRMGLDFGKGGSFLVVRQSGFEDIEKLFKSAGNSTVRTLDGESWTLKKVIRRFIWHDRIHGKAITRILAKQEMLGLIQSYEDPFHFGI